MKKLTIFLLFSLIALQIHAESLKVTLLGTGTPRPSIERFGASTLVEYKDKKFLFDVGRGATIRLSQIGLSPSHIDQVFLTHLHSDHLTGFTDFWVTGGIWQRSQELKVVGPPGTSSFVSNIKEAFTKDISFREKQTNLPSSSLKVGVEEISEGVVYNSGDVRITAFLVEHGAVSPAFGYRLDAGNKSIVVSGDTSLSPNLIEYATGVDLLIHELAVIEPNLLKENNKLKKISEYHSSIDDVEKVILEARPKQTILNHLLILGVSEEKVKQRISAQLGDSVSLGHDLMTIVLKKND